MSYSLGQSEDSDLKSVTAFAEQTSLTEWSDGSIEVSTPKVVVSSQYRSRFSVYSQQGVSSPYIVVSRADAQSRGVPILADPWSAYQAGQKLPGPMAAQVKASGIPIPQEGRRWIPWAIVGGGMMLAVSAIYFFGARKVKPNSRRSSGKKPVTKQGEHGTLYLYEIEFDEGGDPDPGEPPWMSKTKLYGYDREHAIERFYDSYYDLNPGNSKVEIKSVSRVMRYPR